MNASTKFYDFFAHKNYIMQKMRWFKCMSLYHLLFARGRYKHEYFVSALQQFYFQCILFCILSRI